MSRSPSPLRAKGGRAGRMALVLGLLLPAFVLPASAEVPAARKERPATGLGAIGGGGKEPIKIDADRLDVFDRENKAIFAGNVVAVQGDSTIRCSTMTVFYKRGKAKEAGKDAPEDAAEKGGADGNGIQKVECAGPVTVVQKDQVATGDSAVFDQAAKRIVLTGNVVLSQCQNVTRGSRLVYDMNTGRANMDPVAGGRVSALFVPGEKADAKAGSKGCATGAPKASEKAAEKAAPRPAEDAGKSRAQAN